MSQKACTKIAIEECLAQVWINIEYVVGANGNVESVSRLPTELQIRDRLRAKAPIIVGNPQPTNRADRIAETVEPAKQQRTLRPKSGHIAGSDVRQLARGQRAQRPLANLASHL